jgi:hypothetical protein
MTIQDLQSTLSAEGPAAVRAMLLSMNYDDALTICRANRYVIRDNESPYTTLCQALQIDPSVAVTPPNMEPEVQPNITPIAPKRPWGATTTDLEIYDLLGLGQELFSETLKSRLIEVYRMMANETGPTALNTKIIKLMIGNARDSRLFQDIKMVRDQEICDLLDTLKEGSFVIRGRFPSARQLPPERFIFKKTPSGIQYWNLERHGNIMVTATGPQWEWQWGLDSCPSHSFLYKRDPSVPTRDILEAKARSYGKMDEYIANPGQLRGNGLSKIQRIIIDEFRGNLVAVTLEGDVILRDPVMIYHPKFGLGAKVKIVRDSKARRSIKYRNRSHLNSGMKIDRIMLNHSGLIHYDLRRVENLMALNVIREVPETLLEPAQRTKAFGSIAKSV